MQLDADAELAQLPDRLGEVHPALVDADPELFELALHVARGDRAVQLVLFTDLHREAEVDLRDAGRLGFRGALLRGALFGDARRFVGDLLLVGVGRRVGETLRQEVIAGVAVLYLDHVARRAKMLHVFSQDDFHSPSFPLNGSNQPRRAACARSGRGRARPAPAPPGSRPRARPAMPRAGARRARTPDTDPARPRSRIAWPGSRPASPPTALRSRAPAPSGCEPPGP